MERDNWSNKAEFIFACIGYCVGLGNLWRFPYLVYESGGGVFLIPYFIMLFLVGFPLLYMELSIGLISQRGPGHTYKSLCPIFKGLGYASVVLSFLYASYFSTIICYCLYYFFKSFSKVLPWTYCYIQGDSELHNWATENCTDLTIPVQEKSIYVTQNYFDNYILQKTSGIEEFGSIRWELFGLLCLTWVLIYLFIFRGTRSIGKVVYVTSILPYVVLTALLIRGCTLPGAKNGIDYFLGLNGKGDWKKLGEVQVWVNAMAQIFGSIGIGYGSLITFSSYNKTNNNILRDTLLILIVNSLTSIMSGFIIFSVLGNVAAMVELDIPDLAAEGVELVFVAYPQALSQMVPAAMWSIFFFFTLFILGIDSVFSSVECLNGTIEDILTSRGKVLRKEIIAAISCSLAFALCIPNVFQGGIYLYKILDWYSCVQSLAILAAFQVVTVVWIFGANRLSNLLKICTGKPAPKVVRYLWLTITPCLVITIMVFSIAGYQKISYGDYEYPSWAEGLGWIIACLSIVCIPIGMIHEIATRKFESSENIKFRILSLFRPQICELYGIDQDARIFPEKLDTDSKTSL